MKESQAFLLCLFLFTWQCGDGQLYSGSTCENIKDDDFCNYYSFSCADLYIRQKCAKTCKVCPEKTHVSATTTAPPETSTEDTAIPFLPEVGRLLVSTQLNKLRSDVDESLANLTIRINTVEDVQQFLTRQTILAHSDVKEIVRNETSSLASDVTILKERPTVNVNNILTASQVNEMIQQQLTPLLASLSVLRKDIKDLENIVIPTVVANCNSNGELSYSQKYVALCPGNCNISPHFVWGTVVYTTDSYLCAAAIHAGKLTAATGGPVTVNRVAGQISYEGTTRNNITSLSYSEWNVSIRFD